MKKCIYLIFFFWICSPLSAQKKETELDSMHNLTTRAYNLMLQSKYGEAIKVGHSVLEYSKNKKNDTLKASVYNVLGNAYYYAQNDSLSFDYLYKSVKLSLKLKDTFKIISGYNNLGVNFRGIDSIEKSNIYFLKALTLANKSGDRYARVHPLFNIGFNFSRYKKEYQKALGYLNKAMEELGQTSKVNEGSICAEIYDALGYVHAEMGNFEVSDDFYDKGLAYSKKYDYPEIAANIFITKAERYEARKDYRKANEMLREYIAASDSEMLIKEFEKAKQVESVYNVKESQEKLKFIKREKELQESIIYRTKYYVSILVILSIILLCAWYFIALRNRQLKKLLLKTRKLSKAKSDFYSEISHELRTPLYAVTELSNILLRENTNSESEEYLESLKFSSNHLLSLINNVLELNKIEAGKLTVDNNRFELELLITNIIDSMEYALKDSKNTIELEYDPSIPKHLVGDSLKLSQLMINLVANAIKFTNNGMVEIKIKNISEDKKGSTELYFAVKDSGVGISPEMQERIFEDFYQDRVKTNNSYKGTGLGLSIVKRLLNMMGSDINVQSEENKGTTFYFQLTFENVVSEKVIGLDIEAEIEYLKDKKLLVVDDNKINQLVTKKLLNQLGLKCEVLGLGTKAVAAAKETNYDCILMDLNMPQMNGFQATQKIREFDENVAIIALTAVTSDEVRKNIVFSQMDGYVLKPFFMEDFIKEICNGIQSRKKTPYMKRPSAS